jgi:SAM-dependent methyltransferase
MATAWHEQKPRTSEEIRSFYSNTSHYLWELLGWNGSAAYDSHLRALDRIAELWPPRTFPRALDYGSGVGTAALRLAELGYQVTVADVPGITLDFARARFEQRGIPAEAIEVTADVPPLPEGQWDVLVSFDVIEHLPNPTEVGRALVRAIRPGGGAAVMASFGGSEDLWPQHLQETMSVLSGQRWDLYFQALGMKHMGECIYQRLTWRGSLARRLRYEFWRATGLYVQRIKR